MRLHEIERIEQDKQLGCWHVEFMLAGWPRSEVLDLALCRNRISGEIEVVHLQSSIELYDDVRHFLQQAAVHYAQLSTFGKREYLLAYNDILREMP